MTLTSTACDVHHRAISVVVVAVKKFQSVIGVKGDCGKMETGECAQAGAPVQGNDAQPFLHNVHQNELAADTKRLVAR